MILPINPSSLPGNQSVIETSRNCNDLPLKLSLYKPVGGINLVHT